MTENHPETSRRLDEDLLGDLIATTWVRRRVVLVLCLVTGVLAGGVSLIRPRMARVEIKIAIGTVPTGAPLESTLAVTLRIASRTHVQRFLDARPDGTWNLPDSIRLASRPESEDRVVSLVVDGIDPQLAMLVAETAAQGIVDEHGRVLNAFTVGRTRQISEFEALLKSMEEAVRAPLVPGVNGSPTLKTVEEEHDAWRAVVGLAKHISVLKDQNQPPHAMKTRVIFGPDIRPAAVLRGAVMAAAVGMFAGLFLFAFATIVRLAAAPYLIDAKE